jgi:hypothetical protein
VNNFQFGLVSNDLIPSSNNVYDIGTTGARWANGYINNLISLSVASNTLQTNTVSSDLVPNVNNSFILGSLTNRWANAYFNNVDIAGSFFVANFNYGTINGQVVNAQSINIDVNQSGQAIPRLSLNNIGTTVGTGMGIEINGHNGITNTNISMTFDGTSMRFLNTAAGAFYQFNASLIPTPFSNANLGSSPNPWTVLNIRDIIVQTSFNPLSDGLINIGSPSNRWSIVYATTGVINTSDERQKDNIIDEELGLEFITNLRPVSYQLSGSNKTSHGLIAQDVIKTLNQFGVDVNKSTMIDNHPDLLGLCYTELISPLIKSIQELNTKLEDQQAKIDKIFEMLK